MLDDLQKAAFDAMKRDPLSAATSEDFARLPFELLEQLIAENYDCKEADMLKAALLWVKGNCLSPVDAVDILALFRPGRKNSVLFVDFKVANFVNQLQLSFSKEL